MTQYEIMAFILGILLGLLVGGCGMLLIIGRSKDR